MRENFLRDTKKPIEIIWLRKMKCKICNSVYNKANQNEHNRSNFPVAGRQILFDKLERFEKEMISKQENTITIKVKAKNIDFSWRFKVILCEQILSMNLKKSHYQKIADRQRIHFRSLIVTWSTKFIQKLHTIFYSLQ